MSTRTAAAVRQLWCPHSSRVSGSGPLGPRRHPSCRREVSVCHRFQYIGRCRRSLHTRLQDLVARLGGLAAVAKIKLSNIFVLNKIFWLSARFPSNQVSQDTAGQRYSTGWGLSNSIGRGAKPSDQRGRSLWRISGYPLCTISYKRGTLWRVSHHRHSRPEPHALQEGCEKGQKDEWHWKHAPLLTVKGVFTYQMRLTRHIG